MRFHFIGNHFKRKHTSEREPVLTISGFKQRNVYLEYQGLHCIGNLMSNSDKKRFLTNQLKTFPNVNNGTRAEFTT